MGFFMPQSQRVPDASCFRVVRPVSTRQIVTRYKKNPWMDFVHTWSRDTI